MITVGKGGLSGIKGDTETSQSVLKFLPEPHTDFIFAVTAENTGFIGCVSLLLAYALLLSRLIAGARAASDRAGHACYNGDCDRDGCFRYLSMSGWRSDFCR